MMSRRRYRFVFAHVLKSGYGVSSKRKKSFVKMKQVLCNPLNKNQKTEGSTTKYLAAKRKNRKKLLDSIQFKDVETNVLIRNNTERSREISELATSFSTLPLAASPNVLQTLSSSTESEHVCDKDTHLTLNSSFCSNNEEAEKENDDDETSTFRSLGVCEELCIACEALNWKVPTLIQKKSLKHSLSGRDVIGLAETGSGKTAAFALPIIQALLNQINFRGVFALVLVPTRELSLQISTQFLALGSAVCLKTCTLFGGVDMVSQAMELTKKPHVIIATPGRLLDHLQNTKGFNLHTIQFLVMDEADRLLSLDFENALNSILEYIPTQRQTLLFSATMTDRVSKLQRASLKQPVKVQVNTKYDTVKNLVQNMKLIPLQYKLTFLSAVATHLNHYTIMVFVNTCLDAQKIAAFLRHFGFQAICLHGKMSQYQRLGALNSFKGGTKRILVTTEVGSRGLDIPQVDIVINYDVPMCPKDYIHRVGRTARAGRSGRSITFVTPYDVEAFQQIELLTKKRMEPYKKIADEQWKCLHDKVEEIRLMTEREFREQQQELKQNKKFTYKSNQYSKKKKK